MCRERCVASDTWHVCMHVYSLSSHRPCPLDCLTDTQTFSQIGDPVLHIELRKWAEMLVVAPLDANTLAKISTGLCDNLLTCICRVGG
jgi:phosphopantothenoylcysteine synthetase/decarboxylase